MSYYAKRSYSKHRSSTLNRYGTALPKEGRTDRYHFTLEAESANWQHYVDNYPLAEGNFTYCKDIPMNTIYQPLSRSSTDSATNSFAGASGINFPNAQMVFNSEAYVRAAKFYEMVQITGTRLTIECKACPNYILQTDPDAENPDYGYNGPDDCTFFLFPAPENHDVTALYQGDYTHASQQPGFRSIRMDRGGNTAAANNGRTWVSLSSFTSPMKLSGGMYPGGGGGWRWQMNINGQLPTARPTILPKFAWGYTFTKMLPTTELVLWGFQVRVHFKWYCTAYQRRPYPSTEQNISFNLEPDSKRDEKDDDGPKEVGYDRRLSRSTTPCPVLNGYVSYKEFADERKMEKKMEGLIINNDGTLSFYYVLF